jgi:hypothetical protein
MNEARALLARAKSYVPGDLFRDIDAYLRVPQPKPSVSAFMARIEVRKIYPKAYAVRLVDVDFAIHSGTDAGWLCQAGSWRAALEAARTKGEVR